MQGDRATGLSQPQFHGSNHANDENSEQRKQPIECHDAIEESRHGRWPNVDPCDHCKDRDQCAHRRMDPRGDQERNCDARSKQNHDEHDSENQLKRLSDWIRITERIAVIGHENASVPQRVDLPSPP